MKKVYLQPLPIRAWHWINALSFLVLIATGLQIRYKDILDLSSFKTAVDIHNFFGFLLISNYVLWLVYHIMTGKIRNYIPELNISRFVKGSIQQVRYYAYGIFIGAPNPHHATPDSKFNNLQQMAYLNIMLLLIPVQILTGLFLWDIKSFSVWIALLGGIKIVDTLHVFVFLFLSSFLFVHIYLATLGYKPTTHIKAMITGYEEVPEEQAH